MSSKQEIWEAVLEEIKPTVSKGTLALLKSTNLIDLNESTALIGSPSAIAVDLIQKRYAETIKTAIQKHTKGTIEVSFITQAIKTNSDEKAGPLFVEEVGENEPRHTKLVVNQPMRHLPRVRADYTFETLAVSASNQIAYVSAQNVSRHLGTSYNPLFIYGPVGVGKTHLMQAIANEVYRQDPASKIIYLTSEEFTNEVVEAIRSNDTARMKKKFRSANLLIIDDVQFFAGKDKVQEELFHTFNILIDNAAQIVLSSDKPPSEIKKLEARLSSRFAGGLTVDVESPDFEMRTAIILKKAEKFGFPIDIEVAKVIAEKEQDVRSLEGALLRVVTQSTATKQALTTSMATDALGSNHFKKEKSSLHPDEIIKAACEYYHIKSTQIKGPKRDASLVKARQVAMYLLKQELNLPFEEIGNLLGGRDHTTIMHGVDKMATLVEGNAPINADIMGITKILRG